MVLSAGVSHQPSGEPGPVILTLSGNSQLLN